MGFTLTFWRLEAGDWGAAWSGEGHGHSCLLCPHLAGGSTLGLFHKGTSPIYEGRPS